MTGRNERKRIRLAVFALILYMCVLSGCGKVVDTSGLVGSWILVEAKDGSITLPDELTEALELSLSLDPGGTGSITGKEDNGRINWSYENGIITVKSDAQILQGAPEDGKIRLTAGDSETVLVFAAGNRNAENSEDRQADVIYDTGENDAEAENNATMSAAVGDWYGWWNIESSEGEMPVTWYDCCAVFNEADNSLIKMTLWDENSRRNKPLSEVFFEREDNGALTSLNGYFMLADVQRGEWSFQPKENEIYIANLNHDSSGECFRFSIYLHPWGDRWKDAPEGQTPFYFEDWYLPLLDDDKAMPDSIPWQRLEKARENPVQKKTTQNYTGR